MIKKSEVPVEVELVGFPQRDRLLFASLFKVSEMRLFNYLEWKPGDARGPVCLLLDVDHPDHLMRADKEHVDPSGIPIIAIGEKVPSTLTVAAHIKRPIRWAEILHTLDTTLWKAARPNEPMPTEKPEGLADAENELEVQQIDPWYDRKNPKGFKSDPAVLVIDPDPSGGQYIKTKLAGSGYRVDHVPSGADAFALLAKHRYNCVILETQLPDKDGFEICNLLKQRQDRRRTASIILTASQNPLDRMRGALAGCDAFLNKPVKPDQLLQTLEKFLPDWYMK
jgi:twitching motility two-component system response regulator PilG